MTCLWAELPLPKIRHPSKNGLRLSFAVSEEENSHQFHGDKKRILTITCGSSKAGSSLAEPSDDNTAPTAPEFLLWFLNQRSHKNCELINGCRSNHLSVLYSIEFDKGIGN
jgi:hypothetical protein